MATIENSRWVIRGWGMLIKYRWLGRTNDKASSMGNKTAPQISHEGFEWRRGPLIKQPVFLLTLKFWDKLLEYKNKR